MKKLLPSIALLAISFVSSVWATPYMATGLNVQKTSSCTVAEFTSQVTNFGGVTLVRPVQTSSIGTFAVVDYTDSFRTLVFTSNAIRGEYNTAVQPLTKAIDTTATATSNLYGAVEVPDSTAAAIEEIYNYNINKFRSDLVLNGGCALFDGVSYPGIRNANLSATQKIIRNN